MRIIGVVFAAFILSGCSAMPYVGAAFSVASSSVGFLRYAYNRASDSEADQKRKAYERGFSAGMKEVATEFAGKEEMNKSYVWRPPLVSDVDMPARVVNGVMIPAHTEPVIVNPGEWIRTENVPRE